jgi:23S rRNA (cytidine1920-2'-O)/16S rRNA (cytidine1409-2'-O)-methyltransferase
VVVEGRRWLDAGASTGGFTDRLLIGGAHKVIAVDVGYGQLDWRLRNDPRVIVLERTNIRNLDAGELPWPPDGIVADLSFISLTLVLPTLVRMGRVDTDYVLLVKPQFEVGKQSVGKRGVVRDPDAHRSALLRVAQTARNKGLGWMGACPSPLLGPAGNREFFIHLREDGRRDAGSIRDEIALVVDEMSE